MRIENHYIRKKGILQVRCIAHIINLTLGDVFRHLNLTKQSLKDVEAFLKPEKLVGML